MISYREKQLLMTMKMLQDETTELSNKLSQSLNATKRKENIAIDVKCCNKPVETFDDLVLKAKEEGYDVYIRASDILSPEEIKDLENRKAEIEDEFKKIGQASKGDYAFLFSAVALLLAKQIVLKLDLSEREANADETDNDYNKKYNRKVDESEKAKRYYAPLQQIENTAGVPFDVVNNTKFFNLGDKQTDLGLNGSNHRFRSVGHDPLLGLVFGTANILTNTATFYAKPNDKKKMKSYHIKYKNPKKYSDPYIASNASTALMFEKVYERYKTDSNADAIKKAFVKEIDHISSDKDSVAGIPLPFLALIFGDEKARDLALKHFDLQTFEQNLPIIGMQAGITILINLIISWLHKLYILWEQVKNQDSFLEAVKTYLTTEVNQFDKVRTKKIIMYADTIASTINLGVCIGGGIISAKTGNGDLSKEFISHLDIGGAMVTIVTLFKDTKYILKVKDQFIKDMINKDFKKRLDEIAEETMNDSIG